MAPNRKRSNTQIEHAATTYQDVDGPLDGTYCERYNKLVINEGVGFNQPFTWHGNE